MIPPLRIRDKLCRNGLAYQVSMVGKHLFWERVLPEVTGAEKH